MLIYELQFLVCTQLRSRSQLWSRSLSGMLWLANTRVGFQIQPRNGLALNHCRLGQADWCRFRSESELTSNSLTSAQVTPPQRNHLLKKPTKLGRNTAQKNSKITHNIPWPMDILCPKTCKLLANKKCGCDQQTCLYKLQLPACQGETC